ncbi:hypothetical protein ZPAH1_orf00203 [Aeromonas phage ZPAH1]|nr:hypothetical protein ASwh1_154 [Aeromonas phage Aswh_1]QQG33965.1 hypothetical protein ZPAH1_orf00203 [Aeromonas phage ZPAH1]
MTEVTRECDRNDCYDINGFPEDTLVTFYCPEMWGDMRPTTWTMYQVMQIIYGYTVLLPSTKTGEYAEITRMVDTEFTEPFNPEVWEITMENGKSWLCCENHMVLSFYDFVGERQALMVSHYAMPDGQITRRMTRVKKTPKYKAKFWMNILTKDDKPFVLNDTGILHVPAKIR